ncbi:DNA-binding protein [Candidatus Bathyarchaeota archaeon]|nr:DNA-binding protein [Candidatus Bathyarchaeota archaeon]
MMPSRSFPVKELIVARFDAGEDLYQNIKQVVVNHAVKAGMFMVIGAVDRAKYGFYHPVKKAYTNLSWEPTSDSSLALEIVNCTGNVALLDDDVVIHAHITFTGECGEIMGGHLLEGCRVNPTAELTLLKAEGVLRRKRNNELNLALLSI